MAWHGMAWQWGWGWFGWADTLVGREMEEKKGKRKSLVVFLVVILVK
jgi:hypothetical protein